MTTETFPVPELKWKIEKSGEFYAIDEVDADVSSDALEDGGVVAYAKIDILMEVGFHNALIQCIAVVDGQQVALSEKHKIDEFNIEEQKEDKDTYEVDSPNKNEVNFVELEKKPGTEVEEERSRKLWIPLKPVNDINDYQDVLELNNDLEEDKNVDDYFLRPSELPDTPMLKQEKEYKYQSAETAVPVSRVFSSSTPTFSSSIILAIALSFSTLFH